MSIKEEQRVSPYDREEVVETLRMNRLQEISEWGIIGGRLKKTNDQLTAAVAEIDQLRAENDAKDKGIAEVTEIAEKGFTEGHACGWSDGVRSVAARRSRKVEPTAALTVAWNRSNTKAKLTKGGSDV